VGAAIYAKGDMTDAPDTIERIEPFVAVWRAELAGQVSVSAAGVQDRLFELWGQLPEGEGRSQIERWLTETLERHLYEVADIERRLDVLVATERRAAESTPAG
jgi:hypothetical protein